MNYRQWKEGRGWFLAIRAFPQWWREEKKQGKFKIGLTCLGKKSHEVVHCAWREFGLTIQKFSSLQTVWNPPLPFSAQSAPFEEKLNTFSKGRWFVFHVRSCTNVNPTAPGCRTRDPMIWVVLLMRTKVYTNAEFTTVPACSAAERAYRCRVRLQLHREVNLLRQTLLVCHEIVARGIHRLSLISSLVCWFLKWKRSIYNL